MVNVTSVTVGGGSAVLSVSGNDYVATHASMFATMAMQLASVANSFYTAPGGTTLFVVPNDMGRADVSGVSATASILVGDGTTLSYQGSSNALIAAGNGNDTVIASAGNDTIALGSGDNDIVLGTGNSVVYSEGTDSIVSGSGLDTINLEGNSSTVYGGYGSSGYTGTSMTVDDSEGTNSFIFAATKGSLIYGSNITTANGSANFTTVAAFGDTTVDGGATYTHLYAGNGAHITLEGNANGNVLVANDGRWANGNFVDLDGSQATGDNQFWAGSGNSTLIGGTGADTLIAGSGYATMTGGAGQATQFDFFAASGTEGGNVTITDFVAATGNVIILVGPSGTNGTVGAAQVAQALADKHEVANSIGTVNTVFTFSDGSVVTTVTLDNYYEANLTSANLIGG